MQRLYGKKQSRNSWNEIKDLEWIKGKTRIKKKQIFLLLIKFKEALLKCNEAATKFKKTPRVAVINSSSGYACKFYKNTFH